MWVHYVFVRNGQFKRSFLVVAIFIFHNTPSLFSFSIVLDQIRNI